MAIRYDKRVGRTRLKLAAMLSDRFPELKRTWVDLRGRTQRRIIDPLLLMPQYPIHASPMFDCCQWDADIPLQDYGSYHVYSWDTMGDLVRHGFDFTKEGFEIELSAKDGLTP